jgi:hypothetical protein
MYLLQPTHNSDIRREDIQKHTGVIDVEFEEDVGEELGGGGWGEFEEVVELFEDF